MAEGLSVALPLAVSSTDGAYSVHRDLKSVARQSLKMLILTAPGERIMFPNFGVGMRRYLFEQNIPGFGTELKAKVAEQVTKYIPYIRLAGVQVINTKDNNTINLKISYSIPSAGLSDEFLFPISQ
tara:strand:+ start:166 stop:543 length:378 start_codon:yes stop_codon:yes gene_type:complete